MLSRKLFHTVKDAQIQPFRYLVIEGSDDSIYRVEQHTTRDSAVNSYRELNPPPGGWVGVYDRIEGKYINRVRDRSKK